MKFLTSTEYLYPAKGGGEHALRNLMLSLKSEGHEAVSFHNGKEDSKIKSYLADISYIPGGWTRNYIQSLFWKRKLREVIEKENPDYVITQSGLAPATAEVCREKNVPYIAFLINYSHLCISQFNHGEIEPHSCLVKSPLKFKWQYPFFKNLKKRFKRAIKEAKHVFSNSKFMRYKTKKFLSVDSDVLYPPINFSRVEVEDYEPEYITIVNPARYKGGEIFKAIAERMPEEKFLAKGKGEKRINRELDKLENVKRVEYFEDMSELYRKTKILLVPSQWPEPFGMVAPEALYNKIPVLASKTGGLEEATGFEELKVEDYTKTKTWIQKIKSFEIGPKKKYKKHAREFDAKKIEERFIEKISG